MSKENQTFSEAVNELSLALAQLRDVVAEQLGVVKLLVWLDATIKRWRK